MCGCLKVGESCDKDPMTLGTSLWMVQMQAGVADGAEAPCGCAGGRGSCGQLGRDLGGLSGWALASVAAGL